MGLFGSLFGPRFDDPADAMIHWLENKSLDDRRIVAGVLYGGPASRRVHEWILSQPDCDVGTASMILWNMARPDLRVRDADAADDVERQEGLALARFIAERWRSGRFRPAVFEWDSRDYVRLYRRALKKGFGGRDPLDLPEEAWVPVAGRKPVGSSAVAMESGALNDLLGALRLADLAKLKPEIWEPIRRRSLGLS